MTQASSETSTGPAERAGPTAAPERAAHPEAPERAAHPEAPERAAHPEAPERAAHPEAPERAAIRAMLEARSIAIVGASDRPGSFGARLVTEVSRSSALLDVHLVNSRRSREDGYLRSLDDIEGPVDLVLLGVPDASLENELDRACRRGDRSAVVFASAHGVAADGETLLRDRVASRARAAGMALCGAGCMGFLNLVHGLRAIGYLEAESIPAGPIALVTHSGSVFSALLRTRRRLGFTLAVSSGQELVTSTATYLDYAIDLPETRVVALLLEALRSPEEMRCALERAASQDVRVVALTVGSSPSGRTMVSAHSGALAGDDGAWEALFSHYGVTRVRDLDEMSDTLELYAAGRKAQVTRRSDGIATVHDSGAERALVVDLAHDLGVGFGTISAETRAALAKLLDPGLEPGNPLDVWGTGQDTAHLIADALEVLAADDAVVAVALAVDLVHEHDGDDSYVLAALEAAGTTSKPFAVMSNIASAVDPEYATRLRDAGIPVLEGTRTGLLALKHLLEAGRHRSQASTSASTAPPVDVERQRRWRTRLSTGPLTGAESLGLLAEYGFATVESVPASSATAAVEAAGSLGYPVVLKTDDLSIAHKSDAGGVLLGLESAEAVAAAYDDLAERLGPDVVVSSTAAKGIELALGLVRDPSLGLMLVVGAGGVLVELLADRAVSLLPVDTRRAERLLDQLRVRRLLEGVRGAAAARLDSVIDAIAALSALGAELGDCIDALDVNPLICSPSGAVAVDALVVGRSSSGGPATR